MENPIFSHRNFFEIHVIYEEGQLIIWEEGVTWRTYTTHSSRTVIAAEKVALTFRECEDWEEIT